MTDEILGKLREAVLNMDEEGAEQTARELIAAGLDPVEAIKSMASAMTEMGEKFERGEAYVPELLLASRNTFDAVWLPDVRLAAEL